MQDSFSPSDLDAADWRILAELQRDASLSNQALAGRVHVSPATSPKPCAARPGA